MKTNRFALALPGALLVAITACTHAPTAERPAAPSAPSPVAAGRAALPSQPTSFDSVDTYKYHAAQEILRSNAEHTFTGTLPPLLPAIVVLRITVDDTGRVTDVWVQRSPNDEASTVAVAAMNRAPLLPRPFNLANGTDRTLTFSETFLFNHEKRFQLRTMKPIQSAD